MDIRELGYVVVGAQNIDEWRSLCVEILGAMAFDGPDGSLSIKVDGRHARILVVPSNENRMLASGWLLPSQREFEFNRMKLEQAGVELIPGAERERKVRRVRDFFSFVDPAGNSHEIFWGPIYDPAPFVSQTGVTGFVTGHLGLGHVVLRTGDNFDGACEFWERVMGFRLSNSRMESLDPDNTPIRIHWYHCGNGRHHSLALGDLTPSGCQHMMLQVATIDDVGRALDRAEKHNAKLAMGLGRHTNDQMISFYLVTPAGFWMEYGCELAGTAFDWSKEVEWDDGNHGSLWGHKRHLTL
jgi:3,4-dihydroxy-9,10-secoandrosta-1,3,5(10)-triene-9,17-dione 4,5-dioxygenase